MYSTIVSQTLLFCMGFVAVLLLEPRGPNKSECSETLAKSHTSIKRRITKGSFAEPLPPVIISMAAQLMNQNKVIPTSFQTHPKIIPKNSQHLNPKVIPKHLKTIQRAIQASSPEKHQRGLRIQGAGCNHWCRHYASNNNKHYFKLEYVGNAKTTPTPPPARWVKQTRKGEIPEGPEASIHWRPIGTKR